MKVHYRARTALALYALDQFLLAMNGGAMRPVRLLLGKSALAVLSVLEE